MTVIRSKLVGFGHYLPENVVTNDDLSKKVETNDAWIRERTGIRERHIAAEGEMTSDLATNAAKMALEYAKIDGSEVDVIVTGTTSPDNTFPAVSTRVQANIGMEKGVAFDCQAACSGFVYALSVADNMIKTGQAKIAVVIGVETLSRIVDWTDRNTCVLFGDGAGAVVLKAEKGEGTVADSGVISTYIRSDGRQYDMLKCTGGPSSTQTVGTIWMNGREVFRHAVANLVEAAKHTLKVNDITTQDIDWLIPHQANMRILESTSKRLGIDMEKVVTTVDRHANTSAASIPLALSEYIHSGKIKPGQLVLVDAMGGGFTWGAALLRI